MFFFQFDSDIPCFCATYLFTFETLHQNVNDTQTSIVNLTQDDWPSLLQAPEQKDIRDRSDSITSSGYSTSSYIAEEDLCHEGFPKSNGRKSK